MGNTFWRKCLEFSVCINNKVHNCSNTKTNDEQCYTLDVQLIESKTQVYRQLGFCNISIEQSVFRLRCTNS